MNTQTRPVRSELSDKDLMVMIFLAPVLIAAVIPVLAGTVEGITAWLVNHNVLVTQNLVVELPGTNGAGLDLPRVALCGIVVIATLCLAVLTKTRRD